MSNLLIFYLGQFLSGFAFELFKNSIILHIFNITGSALKLSKALVYDNLPKLLLIQAAGYIVDRFNRKYSFIAIDIFQSLYSLSIFWFLVKYGNSNISILFVFTFISAIFKSFTYPSTKAIVPMLVDSNKSKASSFEISIDKIARTLSPVIAIAIFAKYGIETSILVASIFYLSAAILKSFIKINKLDRKSKKFNIIDGIKILKNKAILLACINSAITQMIFHPFLNQVITNIVKKSSENVELNSFFKGIVRLLGNQSEDVYMSLLAILGLASTFGVIASLSFFQFNNNINWKRGMKITTFMLVPISILVSGVIYFGSIGYIDSVLLTYVMLPINILFYFTLNTYTVFFTIFYQENISNVNMGRFIASVMTIFMASKTFGNYIYGYMLSQGFILPLTVLIFASFIKLYIYTLFEKEIS